MQWFKKWSEYCYSDSVAVTPTAEQLALCKLQSFVQAYIKQSKMVLTRGQIKR